MSDLIDRQAAIDALENGAELLKRTLDEMNIVGNDREKFAWGLGLIESCIDDLKELPSAQPQIIRCKGCKHYDIINQPYDEGFCRKLSHNTGEESYCSYAERRTDGSDR